ncbi:hypothetical protein NG799_12925 [Laspinema sp. D1]|uniref:Uncharacterized protein n=1 Tax=Laspinema palackyanum D2a TaxID=2953684 RepID=A0ABT2MR67_9CYAN|nr:hypothetical protein [Laspinema sp. D2b]MCT7967239.1 hypothetical protein [Laspinema sp. D2a]
MVASAQGYAQHGSRTRVMLFYCATIAPIWGNRDRAESVTGGNWLLKRLLREAEGSIGGDKSYSFCQEDAGIQSPICG